MNRGNQDNPQNHSNSTSNKGAYKNPPPIHNQHDPHHDKKSTESQLKAEEALKKAAAKNEEQHK
ncbi:hypothetical protein RchiOBHm_Chr7g0201121 [Rosa chinensis]|uniref:Uncharacterized protein n=1 Tax=Rosa chinensis TaxID=74649 RepID=A0A2P6P7U6_ROSCH|nr:hypothetical protein RchiOBHm_Chr7g0201121 [Rosa chinensis]